MAACSSPSGHRRVEVGDQHSVCLYYSSCGHLDPRGAGTHNKASFTLGVFRFGFAFSNVGFSAKGVSGGG